MIATDTWMRSTPFIQCTGANVIYKNIIQPIFNKHESEIDAALNSIDAKSVIDAAVAAAHAATSVAASASASLNSATSSTHPPAVAK